MVWIYIHSLLGALTVVHVTWCLTLCRGKDSAPVIDCHYVGEPEAVLTVVYRKRQIIKTSCRPLGIDIPLWHLSRRFLVNLKMTKHRVLSFLTLGLAVHFAAIVAIPAVKDVTGSFSALRKSFPLLQDRGLLQGRDLLPTGTCNAETPCPIAACCGTNGLCGYSAAECGVGNCTSKCDSKAECGQYGTPGQQNCPLNVCCSQFGYVDCWIRNPSN